MNSIFVLAFLYYHINDKFLLLHRTNNNSFGAGLYGFVGGKVESGERATQALCREIQEEIGLSIPEASLNLVHTLHRKGTETEFVALCFKVDITGMQPKLNEPEKHDNIEWFSMDQLPENIIPAHKQILESIAQGINYSEHGW